MRRIRSSFASLLHACGEDAGKIATDTSQKTSSRRVLECVRSAQAELPVGERMAFRSSPGLPATASPSEDAPAMSVLLEIAGFVLADVIGTRPKLVEDLFAKRAGQ